MARNVDSAARRLEFISSHSHKKNPYTVNPFAKTSGAFALRKRSYEATKTRLVNVKVNVVVKLMLIVS